MECQTVQFVHQGNDPGSTDLPAVSSSNPTMVRVSETCVLLLLLLEEGRAKTYEILRLFKCRMARSFAQSVAEQVQWAACKASTMGMFVLLVVFGIGTRIPFE